MGEGRGGCFPKAFLPLPPRQGVGGEQSGEYKFGLSEWTIFQKGGDPPPHFWRWFKTAGIWGGGGFGGELGELNFGLAGGRFFKKGGAPPPVFGVELKRG